MREGLVAVAVLGLLTVGGGVLLRARAPARGARARAHGGAIVLRPPRRNAVLLGISALFPAGLLGVLTARAAQLGSTGLLGRITGAAATLVVLSVALYAFAYAVRAHLVVHDTGVERIGVFRRRLVGWGRFAEIAFNPANHWFFVTIAGGSHLWLPADVAGMGEFAVVALRRIPPAVLQRADPVVREVLEELAGAAAPAPP